MIRGKSILNPYATPYIPISKLSTGMSSEKALGTQLGDSENKKAAEVSIEYQLPDSVFIDYDIQSFEKLNISAESSSTPSQQYFSHNTFHDDLAEFEDQIVMGDQSMMLESLSSMFPDISIESLSELLGANNGNLNETIDVLQQFEYDGDGSEYPFEIVETSSNSVPASASASGSGGSV